jgi:hypothetical protein
MRLIKNHVHDAKWAWRHMTLTERLRFLEWLQEEATDCTVQRIEIRSREDGRSDHREIEENG